MAGTSQRGLTFFDADRLGGGVYTALVLTRDFGTVVSCSVALPSVTPGYRPRRVSQIFSLLRVHRTGASRRCRRRP